MYLINDEKEFFTVNKIFYVFVCLSLLMLMLSCSPVEPDQGRGIMNEVAKIVTTDSVRHSRFGYSVAIDGDHAIVGAYSDDVYKRPNSGSVYIFFRVGSEWRQRAKFVTINRSIDRFGYSVAISGNTAIVGAYLDDGIEYNFSGSAYIYILNGNRWIQQAKIKASDTALNDNFGYSVAIDGDYAIVGAYLNDAIGVDSGSAYIFKRSGSSWSEQAKLTASDGSANAGFGWSVAIDSNAVIVGACAQNSAYIFSRNGSSWSQQAKLTASDRTAGDNFGCSVAIDNNTVIVGAKRDNDNREFLSLNRGSAYIFTRDGNNWSEQAKIKAGDTVKYDFFGVSVSIDGDRALVGAIGNDDNGTDSGSAYLFTRNGNNWTQQAKLLASDGAEFDNFGYSISLDGDRAIVGAVNNDAIEKNDGSSYIYQLQ